MSATVVEVDRDECDACPYDAHSEAKVYATHTDWPTSLAFCGHHGTEYLAKLHADGADIIDMRHTDTP